MSSNQPRRSPLFDLYPDDPPMMEFGGWEMPRDFEGILQEHRAVRGDVGVFDLSHMGRFVFRQDGVDEAVSQLFSRDCSAADPGQALYGFICDENGGCIDDVIAYVRSSTEVWMVVNAANRNHVLDWINDQNVGLQPRDQTDESVLIATQGPNAMETISSLPVPRAPESPFRSSWDAESMIATTGYTGEEGVEIWLPVEAGRTCFRAHLEAGVQPCGLGARDTLRLEQGYPLHGHELSRQIDPVTAGLGRFIDWDHEFIGRESLLALKDRGPDYRLTGLVLEGRQSPRRGYKLRRGKTEHPVGEVTSGRYSPSLESGIGLGLIDADVGSDEPLEMDVRGTWKSVDQVSPPFL